MAKPDGGSVPSNGRGLLDRPAVVAGLAMAAVFVVVLVVSLLIGRQNAQPPSAVVATPTAGTETAGGATAAAGTTATSGDATAAAAGPAGSSPGAAGSTAPAGPAGFATAAGPAIATSGLIAPSAGTLTSAQPDRRYTAPTATPAGGQPLVAPAGTPAPIVTYRDPDGDFQLAIADTWQAAVTDGSDAPWPAADDDVTFTQPGSGARLAVSAWDLGATVPLPRAALDFAPGQAPLGDAGPANAMVAGVPALVLWAPESPVLPAVYTTLLQRGGSVYRVSYAAHDGGAALLDYLRLLVSLEWSAAGGSAPDTLDTIPPLPQPRSRYFPTIEPGG